MIQLYVYIYIYTHMLDFLNYKLLQDDEYSYFFNAVNRSLLFILYIVVNVC